jgi:hypothetical protein
MSLRISITRLGLLVSLLCLVVACTTSPVSPAPSAIVTTPTSSTGDAALKMLEQRSLHIPTINAGSPCPTTPVKRVDAEFGLAQGNGPAYAAIGAEKITPHAMLYYIDAEHFGTDVQANKGWGGQKVLWFIRPSYKGLVLVRGRQLDGSHGMRFNQLDQQLLMDSTFGGTPWPNFPSYTRLQAPGCYAYQVDGNGFSYVIVFQAVVNNNG